MSTLSQRHRFKIVNMLRWFWLSDSSWIIQIYHLKQKNGLSMATNHWSNDVMVTIHRYGPEKIYPQWSYSRRRAMAHVAVIVDNEETVGNSHRQRRDPKCLDSWLESFTCIISLMKTMKNWQTVKKHRHKRSVTSHLSLSLLWLLQFL